MASQLGTAIAAGRRCGHPTWRPLCLLPSPQLPYPLHHTIAPSVAAATVRNACMGSYACVRAACAAARKRSPGSAGAFVRPSACPAHQRHTSAATGHMVRAAPSHNYTGPY